MTTVFKKFATGIAVVALLTTGVASGAMASPVTKDITTNITGTTNPVFSEISATSFTTPFALNGKDQVMTGAAINGFTVTDARGTGAGWNVTVKASQFEDKVLGRTLTTDALSLSAPTVTKAVGALGSSDPRTITTAGGNIGVTDIRVLSAAKDGGMGTFDVSAMDLSVNVLPKDVLAGDYTSTVTVSIVAGP
ncbi:WxL domain-containing protein [Planococcus shenhongbingii]|uniref:WxL domain-containing protein n=1 Tax=Planococcus shenhongbingii TaxID=3058398 RepID=UPI002620DF7A|nr:WxL domain-containing protein [Planococcus sp. N016]WKA58331.1 WxL domain-containing protein [Planococcus sp. N016]